MSSEIVPNQIGSNKVWCGEHFRRLGDETLIKKQKNTRSLPSVQSRKLPEEFIFLNADVLHSLLGAWNDICISQSSQFLHLNGKVFTWREKIICFSFFFTPLLCEKKSNEVWMPRSCLEIKLNVSHLWHIQDIFPCAWMKPFTLTCAVQSKTVRLIILLFNISELIQLCMSLCSVFFHPSGNNVKTEVPWGATGSWQLISISRVLIPERQTCCWTIATAWLPLSCKLWIPGSLWL